jgi:hypothetical protein
MVPGVSKVLRLAGAQAAQCPYSHSIVSGYLGLKDYTRQQIRDGHRGNGRRAHEKELSAAHAVVEQPRPGVFLFVSLFHK